MPRRPADPLIDDEEDDPPPDEVTQEEDAPAPVSGVRRAPPPPRMIQTSRMGAPEYANLADDPRRAGYVPPPAPDPNLASPQTAVPDLLERRAKIRQMVDQRAAQAKIQPTEALYRQTEQAVNEVDRNKAAQNRAQQLADRKVQLSNRADENSRRQAEFYASGADFYHDAKTGLLTQKVNENGQKLYHRTLFKPSVDPRTKLPAMEMRDETGQRQFKRPPLKLGTDPLDPNVYADMGDGASQPYMKASDAAGSTDISLARLGLAHQTRFNTAVRRNALAPMKEQHDAVQLKYATAKSELDQLTEARRQLDEQAANITPERLNEKAGGLFGIGGDPSPGAIQAQREQELLNNQSAVASERIQKLTQVVKPGGTLHQEKTRAELGMKLVGPTLARDAHADQEKEILARVADEGGKPEDDPIYVANHEALVNADAAVQAAHGEKARYEGAMAAKTEPAGAPAAELQDLADQGVRSVGGVGLDQIAKRYGTAASPASVLKMNQRVGEITDLLANPATTLDPRVRVALGQEQAYLTKLGAQRMAQLTPEDQQRVTTAAKQLETSTLKTFGKAFGEAADKPLTDYLGGLPRVSEQGGGAASVAAGIYNAAAPIVESFTTPKNLAILAAFGTVGKVAQAGPRVAKAIAKALLVAGGATFSGMMAKDTIELVRHAREVIKDPGTSTQQQTEAVAGATMTGALSLVALAGAGRIAAAEAIPRINAAYPEAFWKKAGVTPEQFAQDYPQAVRRVATNQGTPEDIALVQKINAAAKAAGVKVGDLARGRVVAENVTWEPRAVQAIIPESLKPTKPAGGDLTFRDAATGLPVEPKAAAPRPTGTPQLAAAEPKVGPGAEVIPPKTPPEEPGAAAPAVKPTEPPPAAPAAVEPVDIGPRGPDASTPEGKAAQDAMLAEQKRLVDEHLAATKKEPTPPTPEVAPPAPGANKLTYEDFSKQYTDAFNSANKYTPDQVGSQHFTDQMAKLADENPEHLTRFEAEQEPPATPKVAPATQEVAPETVHGPVEGEKINKEWTAFSPFSKSLGIPRAEMPQVHAEHRGALTQFLAARGITHEQAVVYPTNLKPTQAEYSPAKVDKARKFVGDDRAILVSSDNHVVDGHHQWMAKLTDAPDKPMRVIRLNAPIRELLPQVKEFPSAETASGSTTSQPPASKGSTEITPKVESPAAASPRVPVIKRGENTPARFVQTALASSKGTPAEKADTGKALIDFSTRIHAAAPEAFTQMEVHTLSDADWKADKALAANTPDSAAAYDPDTNTLYLNSDRLNPGNLASAIVHESGHFSELILGEKFTQGEWESLKDEQRVGAAANYDPNGPSAKKTGQQLLTDKRARREWFAQQFARVATGDTKGMTQRMIDGLKKLLDVIRSVVKRWLGKAEYTTEALDRKIVEMLGYDREAPAAEPAKPPKSEPPAPAPEKKPGKSISPELRKELDDLFGTPPDKPGYNVVLPPENTQGAMKMVQRLVAEHPEVRSRKALAEFLTTYAPKAIPHSERLFSLLKGFADVDEGGAFEEHYAPAKTEAPAPPAITPLTTEPTSKDYARNIAGAVMDRLLRAVKGDGEGMTRKDLADLAAGTPLSPKEIDEAAELGMVRAARAIANTSPSLTPQERFDAMVKLYEMGPNLTSKTSTSKINQAYSTPAPLAYLASQLADVAGGKHVTEPTAGNGMLLIEAKNAGSQINEIDPTRRANLEAQGFHVTSLDAASPEYGKSLAPSDRVVANPPFGAVKDEGESKRFPMFIPQAPNLETTDIAKAIAMQTLESLDPDGRGVIIIGAGRGKAIEEQASRDAYISGANKPFFFYLYNNFNVTDHFTVSGDLYAKQGAGWPIDMIVIDGRGKSALPLPWQKAPNYVENWNELRGKLPGSGSATPAVAGEGAGTGGRPPVRRPAGEPERPAGGIQPGGGAGGGLRPRGSEGGSGGAVGKPAGPSPVSGRPPAGPAEPASPGGEPTGLGEPKAGGVSGGEARAGADIAPKPSAPVELNETGMQASYKSRSESPTSVPALTPTNLVTPTANALAAVESRRGKLDDFVAKELGYSKEELFKNLDGGQVDAVALAIDNVKRGGALINGDQTGVGKGRTVAAMLRWAVRQGIIPIFITKNPALYADMLRDMNAVGSGGLKPFMTNSDETVRFEDKDGNLIREVKSPASKKQRALVQAAIDLSMLPDGAKVIFTSYDQIKSDIPQGFRETKKEAFARKRHQLPRPDGQRMQMLRQYAKKGFVVMDESHLAGGESDTGWRVTQMISGHNSAWTELPADHKPAGVYYTSATYAKTPKNMGVYFNTNVKRAVNTPKELAEMMDAGGVPLQQVLSSMLARDGQYIRRELDFAGVNFRMRRTDDNPDGTRGAANNAVAEREKKLADSYTEPLREIINFNKDVLKLVDLLNGQLQEEGITTEEGETLADQLNGTNFGNQLHNMVRQYLFAIKADGVADAAIAALKAGKSPFISVHNTMDSVLTDLAGGGHALNFDGLLHRYLDKAVELTLKKPNGDKQKIRINLDDLRSSFPSISEIPRAAFEMAERLQRDRQVIKDLIAETDRSGIPASPIDHIKNKIEKAGFQFGEISGRPNYLDANGKIARRNPDDTTKAGQNKILARFNRSPGMAILGTLSATTGISAHASKEFRNQQQRVFIGGQLLPDVNDQIQAFGRVLRKGQIMNPEYDILNSTIPAELRLSSILATKLAPLNANTTSSGEGVNTGAAGGVDFLNQYGDEIVHRYLSTHPEIVAVLRNSFPQGDLPSVEDMGENGEYGTGDFARKVSGEIAILPYDDQAAFYDYLLSEYKAHIAFLDEIGENQLRAQNLKLDAETQDSRTIFQGEGDSVFDGPAQLETLKVTSSKKPLKADELPAMAEKNADRVESEYRDYAAKSEAAIAADMAALQEKYGAKENWDEVRASHETRHIAAQTQIGKAFSLFNKPVLYTNSEGQVVGFVTDVKFDPTKPLTPSAHKVTVYVNTEQQHVTIPMSQMTKLDEFRAPTWQRNYTNLANVSTTKRVVTGNLIGGYQAIKSLGSEGKVVTYTTKDGQVLTGIMMPRKFNPTESIKNISTGDELTKALRDGNLVSSPGGAQFHWNKGEIELRVPASKVGGGKYWQDQRLLRLVGGNEMRQVGNHMVGNVREANANELVNFFNKDISDQVAFFETSKEEPADGEGPLGTPATTDEPDSYLKRVVDSVKAAAKDVYAIPSYSGFNKVLNTWVGNRQLGIMKTERAVRGILKVTKDAKTLEAMSNYIDAGGDKATLAQWAAAAKSKSLKAGYEAALKLTPEQLVGVDKVRGWFREMHAAAVAGGVMKEDAFLEDYITHIVKRPFVGGGAGSAAGGKIAAKFKYSQHRTFPNFHELEQAGYETRTKNLAQIMAIYGTHLTNAIETRRLAKSLLSDKNDRGEPLGKLILGHYSAEEGNKANFINDPAMAKEGTVAYKAVSNSAFRGWGWTGTDPVSGKPIIVQGEIGVHPDIHAQLENAIGRSGIRQWYDSPGTPGANLGKLAVKAFDTMQSSLKGTMLGGISTFHAVHEYKRALGNRVAINPVLTQPIDPKDPRTIRMVRAGVMISGDRDAENLFSQGLGNRSLIDKIPMVGQVSRAVSDYTFHQLIPALKWHTFNELYERNLKLLGSSASPEDVAYMTAQFVNERFGHLNLADLGRNPTAQHILGWLTLAPDFWESNLRNYARAAQGAAGADAGREAFKAFVVTALTIWVLARVINQLSDDDPHYEEPFGVIHNNRRYVMRNEAEDLWRMMNETGQYISGRLNPAMQSIDQLRTGKNWRGEKVTSADTLEEFLTKFIPISGRWIPGAKWVQEQTATGAARTVSPFQEFLSSQGVQVARHTPALAVYKLARDFKVKQGVKDDAGTYPVSRYQQLRYALEDADTARAKQEAENIIAEQHRAKPVGFDRRAAIEKLGQGLHASLFHPWTATKEMDEKFERSLSADDLKKLMLANRQREISYRRFANLYGLSATR